MTAIFSCNTQCCFTKWKFSHTCSRNKNPCSSESKIYYCCRAFLIQPRPVFDFWLNTYDWPTGNDAGEFLSARVIAWGKFDSLQGHFIVSTTPNKQLSKALTHRHLSLGAPKVPQCLCYSYYSYSSFFTLQLALLLRMHEQWHDRLREQARANKNTIRASPLSMYTLISF